MKPVKKVFSEEDRIIYQSLYCGLCRCLKYEYGLTGMAVLNYEVVNALLLAGAMAQEPYACMTMSCSLTPLYWRKMAGINEESFRAAAAVTICAAALESQDNLHDSNRWYDRLLNMLIEPKAKRMTNAYRPEFLELKELYDRYMALERRAAERDPAVTFRMLAGASGDIIGKAAAIIGVHGGCGQLKELHDIMQLWGQWIYLIDAADDYRDDLRSGSFNPLCLPDRPDSIRACLEALEAQANAILDQALIRNYRSAVHSMFRVQLPRRRELVLEKQYISKTEGDQREPSIQPEDQSDSGNRTCAAEPTASVCTESASGLCNTELL